MNGEVILYNADDGAQMQLRASEGTVWLTQAEMAELYGTSIPNVAQIIGRVLKDGEVTEATIHSELTVRREGERDVRRQLKVYNLDMILAVGYRVTTPRAVQFRQWATSVLKEYLVKGFAMDDAKLKGSDGWDYFDEWLERIRDIRASEKRFYQKVRDLYATAIDYAPSSDAAKAFFAKVQKQDALGRDRTHRSGDHLFAFRPCGVKHGPHLVERKHRAETRRGDGQELPPNGRDCGA